jgi:hypothetical protein
MVLAAGIVAVNLGALILTLGGMNRASGAERRRLDWIFLYIGGMLLVCLMVVELEITQRSYMHRAYFYRVVASAAPLILASVARASGKRWGATIVTAVYSLFVMLLGWILPLFPAEPKLGPVYNNISSFTPPEFPLLLIVPALALDLLWQRAGHWNRWLLAAASGILFLVAFAAVQWPFAEFLMSPWARNWFFGTHHFGYYERPASYYMQHRFYPTEPLPQFLKEMAIALAVATLLTRVGLAWGDWMRRIRR